MSDRPLGSTRRLVAALAAAAAVASGPVAAQPPLAPAVLPADLATLPFPVAPPSSTATLAEHLARGLAPAALSGAYALDVTVTGAPGRATPARLAAFAADTLEAALRRHHPDLGARLAPDAPAPLRVDLAIAVDAAQLSATLRAVSRPATLWEHLRAPAGHVVATAFAAAPIDLELRTLLGLGPRIARLDRFRLVPLAARPGDAAPAGPVLDLLVDDLDGDGVPELLTLHPTEVLAATWAGPSGFGPPRARASLLHLPPNPARVRHPVGRLAVLVRRDGTRALVAASSDRARAVALRLTPAGLEPLDASPAAAGAPLPDGAWPLYAAGVDTLVTGPWPAGRDALDGPAALTTLGGPAPAPLARLTPAWDLRAWPLHGTLSPSWTPVLAAAHLDGQLRLRSAAHPDQALSLSGHGAASALVDLDADGTPELLATSTALDGPDALTLMTLGRDGAAPQVLWRGRSPAPVTAIAAGDVDRDGYDELVLASWDGAAARLAILAPVAR